jgi:DNA-binding PadR family transcriptional regulator
MADEDARRMLPLAPHQMEILLALAEGPAHGYALIGGISEQSGGRVVLSASSLYAALARLAEQGLVEDAAVVSGESAGPRRRTFRITALGRRVARLEASRLAAAVELAAKRLGGGVPGGRRAT